MPPYSRSNDSNPAAGRDNKKPYSKSAAPSRSAPKGAQREGHRGYRADQATAAPKKRWSADDRAARTGDRPTGSARPDRADRRPDWTPREKPAANRQERPAYGDRPQRAERPAYGDRPQRAERPAYGDRPQRAERPAYGDRPARPAYGDRNERPARTERPAYNDRAAERPAGAERPSYPRTERPARPNNDRAERPARTERPSYDRAERPARTERPSYDRADRPARTERPSYDRAERPARTERPSYDRAERPARPSYDRAERPARTERPSYDRADRAPRRDAGSFQRDDRPARRESNYYPDRESKSSFQPGEDVVLERLEAAVITAGEVDGVTFGDLGLGANIVRQLASMGAEAPFAIQAATIPDVLAGKDVLGRGKTGSGKTIAFGAPLVERLMENNGGKDRQMGRKPRALILAPTRELAMQIDRTVQPIARSVGLFTTTIVGGVPQYKQVSALQRGVDIVIATPGRVEDLIEQGRLDLSNVFVTVLDEADHMCDLGFLEPVQRILHETKEGGQKLLFSATLDKGVATLVEEFLVEPAVHEVAGEDQASSTIDHRVLLIEQRDKREIIEQLASGDGKTLIFTRTRAFAEEMSDYLEDAGIPATSLHGDLNQSRRTRNLSLLTSGRVNVLVATDVAARGIHVDDISLVIQADAPEEYKTYLHRSGRTGRAGKIGTVVTLVNKNRRRKMDELLGRAEIDATMSHVAPGDELLGTLAAL
ncbi:MAG: DEAD/DEAH box helicase [Salinibacterium sp.]|nr:DEAD/DEAH box helicase [Salinibacterium sp.]